MRDLRIQLEEGDGFLVDSNKTGPKIVKFFQTAPTWYIHLWRKIIGKQEIVEYYHAGVIGTVDGKWKIIEQQMKVEINDVEKLLNKSDKICIFRRRRLTKKYVRFF